jgi:hypothetical protein
MKTHSPNRQSISKLWAVSCLLLLAPLLILAQPGTPAAKPSTADQFAGNYKGTTKDPTVLLTLEIKSESGKMSGRLLAPKKEQAITSGEMHDGKLTLKLNGADSPATLVLQQRENKLVGEWKVGAQTLPVEFERLPAVTPAVTEATVVATTKPEPSAAQLLTGEWEAAADAQGQTVPFSLVLKVDGEKVTGSSSSQLGDSTVSGTWKDGKLAVLLEGGSVQTALVGTLVEGKLVGDYDYGGQMQGKWVAAKKKP